MNASISECYLCARDIVNWMVENWLQNNTDKIDIALYGTKQQLAKIDFDHIDLLDSCFSFSKNVRDLGVVFNCNITVSSHITKMFQSAN